MAYNGAQGLRWLAFCAAFLFLAVLVVHVPGARSSPDSERLFSGRSAFVQEEEKKVYCSRPRSRTARAIIDEYLVPFVEQQKYNLSTKCRLHPASDMFREQEEQKDTIRPTQWQCGYCKKLFRTEEYLDKHFDNRHHDKLDMSPSRCVADICGAIHCDFFNSQGKISKRPCNRAAVDRNKHQCESLANTCFPREEGATAMKLHEFFLRQFCDAHTCNRGQKHFPRGSGRHPNKALFMAFSFFTIILLLIFYLAVYLYRRDMAINSTELKRLKQHQVLKRQASKRH